MTNRDTELIDKQILCVDCGAQFTFNTGERRFYWSKGLSEPKRCPQCRQLRRRSIVAATEQYQEEQNHAEDSEGLRVRDTR